MAGDASLGAYTEARRDYIDAGYQYVLTGSEADWRAMMRALRRVEKIRLALDASAGATEASGDT